MKKTLLKTFASLVLVSVLLTAFAGIALAATVTATGGESYLRSTPSIYATQIGLMPSGAIATYLDQSSVDDRGVTWYYVNYNGKTGWVSSKYTSLSGGGSSYSAPSYSYSAPSYSYSGAGSVVATGGESYIRSTPSIYATQVGLMPSGAVASFLGSTSVDDRGVTWYYVNYNGKIGWVSSKYTSLSGGSYSYSAPSYSYSAPSYSYSGAGSVVATGGESYIRSTPSIYATQVGLMPSGAVATYLGSSSVDDRGVAWYHVNYNGKTGWVSSKYTSLY